MRHIQKQSQHQVAAGLRLYLRQVLFGSCLIATSLGCQSISTTTYQSVDQVEIGNAWKSSGRSTQRLESSYREAWRSGYIDGRQNKPQNFDQHKPAQFEAFQPHLREEAQQEWRRGYEDGYASAKNQTHQSDPYGHHQQLFASPNTPSNTAPELAAPTLPNGNTAPSDLNQLQPHFYNPNLESGETAPQPTVPTPIVQPPAETAPAAPLTTPPTPEAKPKYIDEDRVADSWSTLNAAIERSVLANDIIQNTHAPKTSPQVITNSNVTKPVAALTISSQSKPSQSDARNQTYQLPLNPGYNPQTQAPESEEQIRLPNVDVQETFGQPQTTGAQPTGDWPTGRSASANEVLDLPALELGRYQATPMGRLDSRAANASRNQGEELQLEPALSNNTSTSLNEQRIAVADSGSSVNQRVQSTLEAKSNDAHQSVSYELTLDQTEPQLKLEPLQAPKSPVVSQRQLIRNQLPSRLPLRPRR